MSTESNRANAVASEMLTFASEPLAICSSAIPYVEAVLANPERFAATQPARQLYVSEVAALSSGAGDGSPQSPMILRNGIAVIRVSGFLMRNFGMLCRLGLATSTVLLGRDIRQLHENEKVKSIVMLCDSTGGTSMGNEECANLIASYRGRKPMHAFVVGYCCSAMYYLAAAMDKISSLPSALTGSIGVILIVPNYAEYLKKNGISIELFTFGEHKGDGNQYVPMEESARKAIQKNLIDSSGWQFVRSVARHRGLTPDEVRSRYGDGQFFHADDALKRGLIDRIESLDDVFGRLADPNADSTLQLGWKLTSLDRDILVCSRLVSGRTADNCTKAIADHFTAKGRPMPKTSAEFERAMRADFPKVADWLDMNRSIYRSVY